MSDEPIYEQWIANRKAAQPSSCFADQVIDAVEELAERERSIRVADRINESFIVRWTVCVSALFIGSLPLLYAAYVAKLIGL